MAPFKENIGRATVERLADAFLAAHRAFPRDAFVDQATEGLDALELKARVDHVAAALADALPVGFATAAPIVLRAIGPTDFGLWEVWPVTMWVAVAGIDDPDRALPLLAELTSHASAEFAIRPFIDAHRERVSAVLSEWVDHPDEHVRRLVSEGTRPLLPWAPRLAVAADDPGWALPWLDALRDDPSAFVRRSVANHLNDLTKLDRDVAVATAQRWMAHPSTEVAAVVRHGLRSLIKRGDPDALAAIGIDHTAPVEVVELRVHTPRVRLGDALEFDVVVRNSGDAPASAVVDYAVHLLRANGTATRKVFKLRWVRIEPGDTVELRKRHVIAPVTVRRYYPGMHVVDVQCNGVVQASGAFELVVDDQTAPGARP